MALCAAVSFSVALVAGVLVRIDGASLARAVLTGALVLTLAVAGVLWRGL